MEPIEPRAPPCDPIEPPCDPIEPREPPGVPIEPPMEPMEPPEDPIDPPIEPRDPPDEPIEPPIEPCEPPMEPWEPPMEPCEPPMEPCEPPEEPELPLGDGIETGGPPDGWDMPPVVWQFARTSTAESATQKPEIRTVAFIAAGRPSHFKLAYHRHGPGPFRHLDAPISRRVAFCTRRN